VKLYEAGSSTAESDISLFIRPRTTALFKHVVHIYEAGIRRMSLIWYFRLNKLRKKC
jgi:hypothetical protein